MLKIGEWIKYIIPNIQTVFDDFPNIAHISWDIIDHAVVLQQ